MRPDTKVGYVPVWALFLLGLQYPITVFLEKSALLLHRHLCGVFTLQKMTRHPWLAKARDVHVSILEALSLFSLTRFQNTCTWHWTVFSSILLFSNYLHHFWVLIMFPPPTYVISSKSRRLAKVLGRGRRCRSLPSFHHHMCTLRSSPVQPSAEQPAVSAVRHSSRWALSEYTPQHVPSALEPLWTDMITNYIILPLLFSSLFSSIFSSLVDCGDSSLSVCLSV